MARSTVNNINAAIGKKFPNVKITRNNTGEGGYYYIYSDDEKTALVIAGLWTTMIPVYRVSDLTVNQWVEAVERLMNEGDKPAMTDTVR